MTNKHILLLNNVGRALQIEKCLYYDFFQQALSLIYTTKKECNIVSIAKQHNIPIIINDHSLYGNEISENILQNASKYNIDYIISFGFSKILKNPLLKIYKNRIFNLHPSILPAFKGYYDTRDHRKTYPANKILERTLEFGSLIIGNTLHIIDESVDEGYPILISYLPNPYNTEKKVLRHRLFVQECQMLLQIFQWIQKEKINFNKLGYPFIKDALFNNENFYPNLDKNISKFNLPLY